MRVAIVGCGDIAGRYAAGIRRERDLDLVGATDLLPERAEALTREYGARVYASLDEILADESVDTVVNLTVHHAHAEVVAAALNAGKHGHTEKPLALAAADA